MISFVKGRLASVAEGMAVIEVGGLGYEVHIPDNSLMYQKSEGEEVMVHTIMVVREDDISLYGFSDRDSLKMFKLLTTVNGVGAKAGMAILSALPMVELQKAILYEDAASLTRANGVGKKIAQRIVLELKDKIGGMGISESGISSSNVTVGVSTATNKRMEAVEALMSLGYSKSEAMDAVNSVAENDLDVEAYLKLALKQLNRA